MDLKEIRQLVGHLESLRSRRLAQQRELGRLILPSRGLFQGEDTESLRESNLFNPAANRALRKAAAGMTQAVTPASNAWFRHAFLLRDDREATGGNEYVDAVDTLLRSVLSAGGFYRAIHAFNKELLGFGCALLGGKPAHGGPLLLPDLRDLLRGAGRGRQSGRCGPPSADDPARNGPAFRRRQSVRCHPAKAEKGSL